MFFKGGSVGEFRADINGLRAWAVIAVVLYHFGVPGFSGGFVGVDIFFVISGFLMTKIIISGLENNNFALSSFYLARARRIIPALSLLCIILLFSGWFWLPLVDYKTLGTHALTAIIFLSNFKFWRESGYFDESAHDKWLLHTWSLSVEWQFYILLPVALILIWRIFGRVGAKMLLILGGFFSLLLCIYMTRYSPEAAFYLLPTRAWEMVVGGGVWWCTRERQLPSKISPYVETVGFLLIGVSIFLLGSDLAWPGGYAIIPVIGSGLILLAGNNSSLLTGNIFAQRIGESSYSLYLWHWPLVVVLNYVEKESDFYFVSLCLLLSVILGEVSLRLIENPIRRSLVKKTELKSVLWLGAIVLLTVVFSIGVRYQQVEGRLPEAVEVASKEALNINARQKECFATQGIEPSACVYGGNNIKAVVVGDSHADAMISAVQFSLRDPKDGVLGWTYVSCPTIRLLHVISNPGCYGFNDWVFKNIVLMDKNIPVVLISRSSVYALGQHNMKRWMGKPLSYFSQVNSAITENFVDEYSSGLTKGACDLAKSRRVFMLRPIPEMMVDVPKTISRNLIFSGVVSDVSISIDEYHKRHAMVWAAQDKAATDCGVIVLDPLPYLCDGDRCWGSRDGRPIYYDDDHLSEYGNKLLVPMFREVFTRSE